MTETTVSLTPNEAAMLRGLIYTAAVTGLMAGPDTEVYAIEDEGFDVLLAVRNKLEVIPLPA